MGVEVLGVQNVGFLQLRWKYVAHDRLAIRRSNDDGTSFKPAPRLHGKLMSQAQDMAQLVQENIRHDPVIGVRTSLGGPFGLVEGVLVYIHGL